MKDFEIFADSGCNLGDELIEKTGIKIISFYYNDGKKEKPCYDPSRPYRQTAKEFYELMRSGADVRTSLINAGRFEEEIAPALENGKDALIVTISSGISGTYAQAKAAAKALTEKYPRRKVIVADSANASLGTGLLCLKAAQLRDMGESVEACAKWIENNAYKLNSYLTVGDLKYLRKSGRISAAAAIAGSILNIKPVIRADGGANAKLAVFSRERGRKRAIAALLNAYDARSAGHGIAAIAHCDCEEEANELAEKVKEHGAEDVIVEFYDPCTGAHAGPGTIALFFFGKDRRGGDGDEETVKRGKAATQKI